MASQIPLAHGFQVLNRFIPCQDVLLPSASYAGSSSPKLEEEEMVVQAEQPLASFCPLAPQLLPPAHALVLVPVGVKLTG